MLCTQCGHNNRQSARFCGACGAPLGQEPSQNRASKKRASIRPGIIGIVALALVVVALIILFASGKLKAPVEATGDSKEPSAVASCVIVAFLALSIYAAFKENSTTGLFKSFGVYGRVQAYLFANCAFGGTCLTIGALISPFINKALEKEQALTYFIIGVAAVALSIALYVYSRSRCPEMLKHRLLGSMFLSGLGITIKLTFFFLLFLFGTYWALEGPREMVDEDGRSVFVYHDDVYDHTGWRVGYVDPYDDSRYIRTD